MWNTKWKAATIDEKANFKKINNKYNHNKPKNTNIYNYNLNPRHSMTSADVSKSKYFYWVAQNNQHGIVVATNKTPSQAIIKMVMVILLLL